MMVNWNLFRCFKDGFYIRSWVKEDGIDSYQQLFENKKGVRVLFFQIKNFTLKGPMKSVQNTS